MEDQMLSGGGMVAMREVEILSLGVVQYEQSELEMRGLQSARVKNEIPDTLLILEHPEIVTIGPKARRESVIVPSGYATTHVDRGGGITYHGPGQIVVYPIFKWNLENEANVKKITSKLEKWAIAALSDLGIAADIDARMQGVWVDNHKIGSVGLAFMKWVSRHGFTINYGTTPGRVENLNGCGLENGVTTSLSALGYSGIDRGKLEFALLSTMEENLNRSEAKP